MELLTKCIFGVIGPLELFILHDCNSITIEKQYPVFGTPGLSAFSGMSQSQKNIMFYKINGLVCDFSYVKYLDIVFYYYKSLGGNTYV